MSTVYATTEGRGAFVRMDFNEGPPPPADLLAMDLSACLAMYPEYGALKLAAARAWGVAPEAIVPVNGADEGILLLLRVLGAGGLVLPVPAFTMYHLYAGQLGVKVNAVPLNGNFDLDLEATLAAPGGLVALTSPNNPTGRAVPAEALLRVLRQGRTVLLDETYGPYCGQDCAPLLAAWPNLILLRTLSKAYGVPGLRCGFVLAAPDLAAQLDGLRSPFNVNAAAAALGARLLAEDTGFPRRVRAAVEARRELQAWLQSAGYPTVPSDAHFFLAELGPGAGERLRAQGILIKDQGSIRPGFYRISVACAADAQRFAQAFLGDRP